LNWKLKSEILTFSRRIPRRDWRDWFIMATVMGGVGFGLYVTAKRYIIPLIKPPTPAQLSQDKESIDESFARAFAALEALEGDTKLLKEAETARTARLDAALAEVEAVVAAMKENDRKREDDSRRNTDGIRAMKDSVPRALESQKNSTEAKIKDLATELKSLRTLMGSRLGTAPAHRQTPSNGTTPANGGLVAPTNGVNGHSPATTPAATTPAAVETSDPTPAAPAKQPSPVASSFPRFGTGKAMAIPAWQMAASKKADEPKEESANGEAAESTPTAAAAGA
jgi:peroxin-14